MQHNVHSFTAGMEITVIKSLRVILKLSVFAPAEIDKCTPIQNMTPASELNPAGGKQSGIKVISVENTFKQVCDITGVLQRKRKGLK